MSAPLWIAEAASDFWALVGEPEPFPRQLRGAIARALALAIVQLPGLRLAGAEAWLRACGVVCDIGVGDRALRAALVARYGHGFLFIDGRDSEAEQRISVAHELAHFLRHYRHLRRRVRATFGETAVEVLDGERPASPSERMHSLLAKVPIGYYVHLMQRGADGQMPGVAVETAEREADLLAYELLAPEALLDVQAQVSPAARRGWVAERLVSGFGFPEASAADYAALLAPDAPEAGGFLRRLRLAR